jgi:hypothetical protein
MSPSAAPFAAPSPATGGLAAQTLAYLPQKTAIILGYIGQRLEPRSGR